MPVLNIYLSFEGNCEEAFNFYKSVFGGEFSYIGRFSDMPPQKGVTLSDADKNKIMHVSLPISKETVLMGSDAGGEWSPKVIFGNNFSISVAADSREQADSFYRQLSADGQETMPMQDQFWGDYFGMLKDKFGIHWMITHNPNYKTSG
ncbi:MAG TPA: VOC family protein [Chitinophagaceae bacterium]|nr:VOC family protein [Chitinophagaceae bacterium]